MIDPTLQALGLGTVERAIPLILAAMGGYLSERSGVINIALEGKMMAAIGVGAYTAQESGSAAVGLAGGIGAAVVLGLIHWAMTQIYRVDHIVSGMALNLIGVLGIASYLIDEKFPGHVRDRVPTVPTWVFMVLAAAVPIGLWLLCKHTRFGIRLMAVGSDPNKARQMGVSPAQVRLACLIGAGVCCGLAGGMILANEGGAPTEGMTAGRGFIALAALIIGGWRPVPAALAALLFGFFEALRANTAFLDAYLPSGVTTSLPYIATVIALAGFLGQSRTPAGLGRL